MKTAGQSLSPWMFFPVPEFPPLPASARADVCVVGAGMAGISTAYLLTRKGKRVIVVSDSPLGGGMTSRTTAHLASAIDDRYHEIERLHGEAGAKLAAESHAAAIEAIEAIVAQENIDCDFARLDGFLFLPPGGDMDELIAEHAAAVRAGVEGVGWVARAPIPGIDTGRCLRFPQQGQFHPMKYLAGLAAAIVKGGGAIHCGSRVEKIEGGTSPRVHLAGGLVVECPDVVVATNAPINTRVAIHTKQAPYITYVIAARVPPGSVPRALLWDTLEDYHYVRLDQPEGELLIVGGEDHKTGQADDPERRFANLELWMRERYPMAREVVHRWSGQVMETVDGLAYLGRDPGEDHVFIATGDSGMGMTHSTIGAILITDLIHGAEAQWTALYDPARKVPIKAAGRYARENLNVARQFTAYARPGEVESVAAIVDDSGAILRRGVHRLAVYRDAFGTLHEMSSSCTHLGCPVQWNPAEKTWDCTCHGSRFDAHGRVISGPAVLDLAPAEPDAEDTRPKRDRTQPPATRH